MPSGGSTPETRAPDRAAFKVSGNCDMCKARIEAAARSVGGVASAEWDPGTKRIQVRFTGGKTVLSAVHKALADSGHGNEMFKALRNQYDALPECCKYR